MTSALAFDLGGTQLRAAVVDRAGHVSQRLEVATDAAGGPQAVLAQMVTLAKELSGDFQAAGVCAPGPLDSARGVVLGIPTLPGWEDYPLRAALADALGLPVVLENDGIAAAHGEWQHGAGQGLSHLVYVTLSTGIGGGVVADGRLLRGRHGMAGHVGHMMIAADGPACACGGRGCFEALASGTAFGAAARARGFSDGAAAVTAARSGDAAALALLAREAEWLGYGFTSLLHLYSPQRLIIGGGLGEALDLMLPVVRATINTLAMPAFRAVDIVPAALGGNDGLVGVAGLACELLQ